MNEPGSELAAYQEAIARHHIAPRVNPRPLPLKPRAQGSSTLTAEQVAHRWYGISIFDQLEEQWRAEEQNRNERLTEMVRVRLGLHKYEQA